MDGSNGEGDNYSGNITTAPSQSTSNQNYANNSPSAGSQGNTATAGGPQVDQQPGENLDFIYLEHQGQFVPTQTPARPVPSPQTPTPPVPFAVPQNQSTTDYQNTTQALSAVNHGYVPESHPPSYNNLYGKGNSDFTPGPQVYQPQPWHQQFQPNYHGNVVVTTQPKPVPSKVVFVNSVPQRNPSEGLATASLVMAIIGIFCCSCSSLCAIPAIVFAALSLQDSTDPEKSRTYANISMICTVIGWVCGFTSAVLFFVYV